MSARSLSTFTVALLVAPPDGAAGGPPLPPGLRSLKPYQVVEQIMAHREVFNLGQEQFDRLDAISLAVHTEKHRFIHRGSKPHGTRHVTMVSRGQAFERAMTVLTSDQHQRVQGFFQAPLPKSRVERRATRLHAKP